jgi:hypothetical protein
MVIGVSFSKEFSNSIYAGAQMKIINESISTAGANGVAFDAGIQYVTGDGFSTKVATLEGIDGEYTLLQRGTSFELPTQLIIGGAYDLLVQRFKVSFAGSFVSNSFSRDQMIGGLEFSYNNMLFLRGGYTYESDVMNSEISTALNGPSAGLSVRVPLSKETKSGFTVDFSYRSTVNFSSIYTFGIGISF